MYHINIILVWTLIKLQIEDKIKTNKDLIEGFTTFLSREECVWWRGWEIEEGRDRKVILSVGKGVSHSQPGSESLHIAVTKIEHFALTSIDHII